jgi:selenocysteine lyase/cysteine desulfurase
VEDLRAQFPVLDRIEYLNAGTTGPVPTAAQEAAAESLRAQLEDGRSGHAFFEECVARIDLLRARVAALMGADAAELALTGSTTDGVNAIVSALDLGPGDEVLTSDQEHPGVLAPLGSLRERRGVTVRVAPFDELPAAVGPATRLVACSHVSWHTGSIVDVAGLAATDALVLLDGAQGLGAVPLEMAALGCDFYAASGQKWMCGPNGLGYLYARAEHAARLIPAWPGYASLADATKALELELQPDARRLSIGFPAPHQIAWALAALDVLEGAGWAAVHERAASLAAGLADRLGERAKPRGRSTLVAWRVDDPEAEVERLRGGGFAVRNLPGQGTVRASVGAWSSEAELARLAELTCS